jgi:hypothetical protein
MIYGIMSVAKLLLTHPYGCVNLRGVSKITNNLKY